MDLSPGISRTRGFALIALIASVVIASVAIGQQSAPAMPDASMKDVQEALRRGEAVVLMRHALAPGTGDPAKFKPGDCATQRNLSAVGRRQATAIGQRLIELLGEHPATVFSSAWCRCLDTARLLGLGDVQPLAALDSIFRDRAKEPARTKALQDWIQSRLGIDETREPTAVLVTHQANITALTGRFAASGEMIIVTESDGLQVVTTIETDAPLP